jgi:two-component system response regulator YesN
LFDVVIAEDELWIRSAIGEMVEKLSPEFHVVGEVGNGEDAWQSIQDSWPSILITDIMMPRQNGLWLAEQIYHHELPMATIIVSGYDNFQYAKQAMRFGIFEYLLKPLNEEELHGALRRTAARLSSLSGTRETITRLQHFAESLPELSQQELSNQMEGVLQDTFLLRISPDVRKNLFLMLSNRFNELIQGVNRDFTCVPLLADSKEEVHRHFKRLLEAWNEIYPQYANHHVKMAIRKVCEHLDTHYAQTYTLSEAAEMAHLSVSYFSALFKKSTGLTYLNYVNQLRIEKAKVLLLAPEIKIYEVADQVGFTSLPYFNRTFKQITSLTPLEYRKSLGI